MRQVLDSLGKCILYLNASQKFNRFNLSIRLPLHCRTADVLMFVSIWIDVESCCQILVEIDVSARET